MQINLNNRWRQIQGKLALLAGNEALNAFLKNYRDQSFFGEPWKEVQRRTPGTRPYKYGSDSDHTRGILIGKGAKLFGSIRGRQINYNTFRIASNLPYANVHNEGTKHVPKRQFAGNNAKLTRKIRTKLTKAIQSQFK